MIEVGRVVDVECQKAVVHHPYSNAGLARSEQVAAERTGAIGNGQPGPRGKRQHIRSVQSQVGYQRDGGGASQRRQRGWSGQVAMHHDHVFVAALRQRGDSIGNSSVQALVPFPQHRRTVARGERGDVVVVTDHVCRQLAGGRQHSLGGPASQPLAFVRVQSSFQALLGLMERLDRNEHCGVHGRIVGTASRGAYDPVVPHRLPTNTVHAPVECTIGVLGGDWRGSVTSWGAVQQWDGLGTLDWFVAADDRWHTPASEPTVRQSRIDGTPVVETRLRVPQGDVMSRVFAVADHGGLTVIEITNDSPLPVAVALSGAPVMSVRAPADVPIRGIELPADTSVFPIGHHATLVVGLAHLGGNSGTLPGPLPTAAQVARGWSSTCQRASRLVLPEQPLVDAVMSARCELALVGPPRPGDDPVGFLLAVDQLVRMTGAAPSWMPDVAQAVEALARSTTELWNVGLDAAEAVARRAEDDRAVRDLDKVRARLVARAASSQQPKWLPEPATQTDVRFIAAVERGLALGGDLLAAGMPTEWLGHNFEVHDVPTGPASTVSFAVRWHGQRPAVLWQCAGAPVTLTSSQIAPGWSTDESSGETLWPAPLLAGASSAGRVLQPDDLPASFS